VAGLLDDTTRREAIGRSARQRASQFSVEAHVAAIHEVYLEALADRAASTKS
jgi:glycosyltransferase involved in cell wall biosynthesis